MRTQTTDEKIINSGAMQYLMRFPAGGRLLRVTTNGSGVVISIADDLGSNGVVPFMLACRSLRVELAETKDQATMWSAGSLEHGMPFPAEGRLIRVTVEGEFLVAAVADGLGRPQDALPFTHAFRSLHVEPVLDPDAPFAPYNPGVFCASRSPEAVESEDHDVQHATT